MRKVPNLADRETVAHEELLSLEAIFVCRAYLYTLFHKALGGEPNAQLLELMASRSTIDVVEEYTYADQGMTELGAFFTQVSDNLRNEQYVDAVRSEFAFFFEGPDKLPAYPWESPYISHDATIFQKSTLAVRNAYLTHGFKAKMFQRVADDHISLMCSFMAYMAEETLKAFRECRMTDMYDLVSDQYGFVRQHMNNWLPEFAELACSTKTAYLYPQLAKGIESFAKLDEIFTVETLLWAKDMSKRPDCVFDNISYDRDALFGAAENALKQLKCIQLLGLEENELVSLD